MKNKFYSLTPEKRLQKLIASCYELKFLVGFFYFSGWQEIYKRLIENDAVKLKILVGLQVDKYLSRIVEIENEVHLNAKRTIFKQLIFIQFLNTPLMPTPFKWLCQP